MKKVILFAVLALVAILLIAAVVVDVRYNVLFASKVIPESAIASDYTSFRLRVEPARIQDYLVKTITRETGVPPWVVPRVMPRVMPYEIAILCDPDLNDKKIDTTLYINDQRLGPVIAEGIRTSGVLKNMGPVQWRSGSLERPCRGELVIHGEIPVQDETVDLVRGRWHTPMPDTPLTLDGGHFVEFVLDQRDGRGFALLAEVFGADAKPGALNSPKEMLNLVKFVDTFHCYMDPVSSKTMKLRFEAVFSPDASDSDVNSFKFLATLTMLQLVEPLKKNYGVKLNGEAKVKGHSVIGEYRLENYPRLFDTIQGNVS